MTQQQIDKILNNMTLDQKLGQMCMAGICGGETLDFARENFEKYHFGGLMYSALFQTFVRDRSFVPCGVCKNIGNEATARFLHDVKQLSMEIDGIPCIIGGDQEGGLSGSFLRRGNMTILPKQMAIAASPTAKQDAYKAAFIAATEVKAMGWDMLYGPVMDVNVNPANPEVGPRSFSDDPQVCAELGAEYIRAYADAGIISTAKHFPGRGRGKVDAHFELESFDVDKNTLLNFDLLPFKKAIEAGTEAIMVCHTIFSTIDDKYPASISHKCITGILRNELGFDGLVIPDTMTMWAISKNFDVPKACAMVLEAGGDMFFMKDPPRYDATFAEIKKSISEGRLSEQRIEQSVRRILNLKAKFGLFDKHFDQATFTKSVGNDSHNQTATELAQNSLVVLKDADDLLPCDPQTTSITVIVPREMFIVQANDPERDHTLLPRTLAKTFKNVQYVVIDPQPTELQLFEALARARNADIVVSAMMISGYNPGIKAATEKILTELDTPVVALLACGPYVVDKLPKNITAAACTFCEGPAQFQAFAEYLTGKLKPQATLPVTLEAS